MTSSNTFFTAVCAFLFSLVVSLSAADEQYRVSGERIETIKSIIAKAVADKEDLTSAAVIQSIYDRIGAEMPLTPEAPLIQPDLKKLNEEAHVKALEENKINPAKLKARLADEAKKLFPMDTPRSRVTVVYRRGAVTGTLYKINATSILVNNTTIPFIDMDKKTRSRFDAQVNKDLQEQYVLEHLNKYRLEATRRQQKIFEELFAAVNLENEKNGYIFIERKETWKTAKEIAAEQLAVEVERYKKNKEKQERARRRREAKEKAAREAKEKADAEARAAASAQTPENTNPEGNPVEASTGQNGENPFARSPDTEDGGNTPENANPQDMFASDKNSDVPQQDEGGTFIALTPEQLAALSRPKVNENDYKALMAKIEEMQGEIDSKYFGIDVDQGFKKALWGFRATDVFYALSKEPEAAFFKKGRINRDDILYPEGSRPKKVYLYYHLGELFKVDIYMGNLKQNEFNIYKNSLQQKYGKSDTQKQMGDDVFFRIVEGSLSSADLPDFADDSEDPGADRDARGNGADNNESSPESSEENEESHEGGETYEKPYFFVWEGSLSRGVLSFYYNKESEMYEDVIFEKVYIPSRLKKLQEQSQNPQPAAAEAPAAAE